MKLWRIALLSLITSLAWGQKINLGPPSVNGTLQPPNCPAITGDTTASANTCATTTGKVNGVTYPTDTSTNTVPVKTSSGAVTYEAVPNAALGNSSIVVTTAAPLGGAATVSLGGTLALTCTGCSTTTGTVTSIATTTPITGGTITSTGTIACATCVVASSPGIGLAHFAGSTQTVTSSAVNLAGADVTGQLPISGVGSSGLSGTSPITISAAGAIGCATCNTTASNVTSVFTRTGAVSAAANDYTLDLIGNPAASVSFTAPATNTYSLLGTAPGSVSGAGTAAGTTFTLTSPAGGATTGSATTGGTGGDFSLTTGAGGSGAGGTNANGGRGGNFTLALGAGGAKQGSGTVGAVGQFIITGGPVILPVQSINNTSATIGMSGAAAVGINFSTTGKIDIMDTQNVSRFAFDLANNAVYIPSGGVYGISSNTTNPSAGVNSGISNGGAGIIDFGSGASTNTSAKLKAAGYMSVGTTFTSNNGCTEGTLVGGATAGSFKVGQNTACTIVITMGNSATAPNGWACIAYDETAVPAVAIRQTTHSTTSCSLLMTVATNDVIVFQAIGF